MMDWNDWNDSNEHISDEALAAFIDGNATAEEAFWIQNNIGNDALLAETIDIVQDTASLSSYDWGIHDGDYGFWELGLPPIVAEEELEEPQQTEDINNEYDIIDESDMNEDLNKRTFGESGENLYDPVYIRQPDDHSCALRSQQIVLRDFGIDIPFKDLEKLALDAGVYTNEGTYTYDIGKVLEMAGVGMHQVQGTSFYDLTNELAQGHRVIVSVDADELWYNESFTDKLKNWFDDIFKHQGGNHALIVAGVEVNPSNSKDVKVILTDPGAGHLRVEYPLDQFMDAWKDSNCFMAATDNPAPYQYDADTGMEVPSNFVVEQYVNQFVIDHRYQLEPDMINVPQDYQPCVSGYIDYVGNLDYEAFHSEYENYVENQPASELTIKQQIEEQVKNNAKCENEAAGEELHAGENLYEKDGIEYYESPVYGDSYNWGGYEEPYNLEGEEKSFVNMEGENANEISEEEPEDNFNGEDESGD